MPVLAAESLGSDEPALPTKALEAVLDEIKHLPIKLATLGHDPTLSTIDRVLSYFVGQPEYERFLAFVGLVRRLRIPDQQRTFEVFVAPQDG